jgi:toxin-antitoxin system PIN domain toxin
MLDVNNLDCAARLDAPDHHHHIEWLEELLNGNESYSVPDLVFSGFLRIVTNSRIFKAPSTLEESLAFVDKVRGQPHWVAIHPGPRHWAIFVDLCGKSNAKGNRIPDAYFAAMAIETGSEWITMDRGFSRFPGLRWRAPW